MDPSGQESHAYAYANANPISYKDPSGLISEANAWLIGALIQYAIDATGIWLAATIATLHPIAGLIVGAIWAATGGAIGAGVTAALQDLNPSDVQARALYGALSGGLSSFVDLGRFG